MLILRAIRDWAGVLALGLVLTGGAVYAGAQVLQLGVRNDAAATTTLKNTGEGPALKLLSAPGSPSLAVSSREVVDNLNASLLEGKRASEFAPASGSKSYLPSDGFQLLMYKHLSGMKPGVFFNRAVRAPGPGTVYVSVIGQCSVNQGNPVFLKASAGTGSLLITFGNGLTGPSKVLLGCTVETLASTIEAGQMVPVVARWGPGSGSGHLSTATIMVVFSPERIPPH